MAQVAMRPHAGLVPDVVWRPLGAGDLAYVAALEAQIHAAPWTLGNFRDAIAAGYWASVGECEGRILAYGVLMLAPGEAQVLNLSVVHDARRRGLGRALLRRFVAVAIERGAEQVFLEVRAGNAPAIALYAAEDFLPVARRADYYPGSAPDAPREDALWRDEHFVPLVLVSEVDSLDEAITEANRSDYGLTAGFYGAPDEIGTFLDRIEAGVTYVNRPQGATTGAWPGYQPFGGWKASGSTGKAIGSFWYLPLYLREQSQTIVD